MAQRCALGDMGAYSFNQYKTISCGEGGAFVARDMSLYERALILQDGGILFRPQGERIEEKIFCGMNLRGNEILASIMRVQLGRLPEIVNDLHTMRALILSRTATNDCFSIMPFNGGPSSGTASHLGLQFPSEAMARCFLAAFERLNEDDSFGLTVPYDSDRHVYMNWAPVIEKRGAACAARDPFSHPLNMAAQKYSADLLPRTLDILRHTILMSINPNWTYAQAERVAEVMAMAAAITGPA